MRDGFAHQALLTLAGDVDPAAVGAAVTTILCGAIDHEPPCPLAPHHTAALGDGAGTRVRVLFATEPEREAEVRRGVETALAGGARAGLWRVEESGPAAVAGDEEDHVRRLAAS